MEIPAKSQQYIKYEIPKRNVKPNQIFKEDIRTSQADPKPQEDIKRVKRLKMKI